MFSESGEMRVAKAKSVLKKVLQKQVSSICTKKAISTAVLDGSAILYLIPWPASSAIVGDFVVKFFMKSCSKVMMYFLSLIGTENTVQNVLQEFHVGLS